MLTFGLIKNFAKMFYNDDELFLYIAGLITKKTNSSLNSCRETTNRYRM